MAAKKTKKKDVVEELGGAAEVRKLLQATALPVVQERYPKARGEVKELEGNIWMECYDETGVRVTTVYPKHILAPDLLRFKLNPR